MPNVEVLVTLALTVVGALLGLVLRANERRIRSLETSRESHLAQDEKIHSELESRLRENELKVAKLENLESIRDDLVRLNHSVERLLEEVATLKGALQGSPRTRSSRSHQSEPPPKRT